MRPSVILSTGGGSPFRRGVSGGGLPLGGSLPPGGLPLEEVGIPLVLTPSGGHCSGRYASYWNAFLLAVTFSSIYGMLHAYSPAKRIFPAVGWSISCISSLCSTCNRRDMMFEMGLLVQYCYLYFDPLMIKGTFSSSTTTLTSIQLLWENNTI